MRNDKSVASAQGAKLVRLPIAEAMRSSKREDRVPVLFLPGLLCDAEIWQAHADALADCCDPLLADLTQDDSIAAMAARALSIAPARFALVALSMGGYVAFEMIRQARHRVTALALFDTSAAADSATRIEERQATISSLAYGRFTGVTRRLLPKLIHTGHLEGSVCERLKSMAGRVGGAAFRRQQLAIMRRPDSRPLLPTITVPTLVAVGDSDVLTPPTDALQMHLAIRNSSFAVLRDCGHLPPFEKPAETLQLLESWLGVSFPR